MARILSDTDSFIEIYDNHQVSSALESFLVGDASKSDKRFIDDLLGKAKLTVSDLRSCGFKDTAKHLKMADELIHRQYQTMRHLQRSIDSVDFKSRLIKRMDLELVDLEDKTLTINVKPS